MLGLYHNSDLWRPPERLSVPQKQKQKQKQKHRHRHRHRHKTQDYELLGPTSQDCKRKREVGLRLGWFGNGANHDRTKRYLRLATHSLTCWRRQGPARETDGLGNSTH
ncbi:uncharacterized protein GLRG_05465 [Colletotrichum graminicola M1.001]|uniref:Uncharacterized protein n=1 Tax=Colletotrichum graminicola (strain M1.001 / M2 / FGSC 10212) TaxID=645133 RepID=E3QHF9_COLGM|nr:uncharacterized protein GLRG_05465 [Colletotrichum graminicola M1.001]EFQ30321.1 hypothetical protein GLRG_05465 [Colletotrichum graminicola M1.001]